MMREILLIGGPMDGDKRMLEGEPPRVSFQAPIWQPAIWAAVDASGFPSMEIERIEYVYQRNPKMPWRFDYVGERKL